MSWISGTLGRSSIVRIAACGGILLGVAGLGLPSQAGAAAVATPRVRHAIVTRIVPNTLTPVTFRRTASTGNVASQGLNKESCIYANHSIALMNQVGQTMGRAYNCALVYNDASQNWAAWEDPWFAHHNDPDLNWANWVKAKAGRQLIITQNLFPASENAADWRDLGASGAYTSHAVALASNLVRYGLGAAVIRLGHEANGTWYPDSIGNTQSDYSRWVRFWRLTVQAMRSVPGAHFKFDWCVNAAVRDVPLAEYYPGDDVVDIVGIDAYDAGVKPGQPRWSTVYNRPIGIGDLLGFAKAHKKPLSIPEWGLTPSGTQLGGDDDPAYIDGIASVVRNNNVAYQSYFYKYDFATLLSQNGDAVAAYRRHFGASGDSVAG